MINISVTVSPNLTRLAGAFNDPGIKEFLRDEIRRFSFTAERYAKQIVPVRTGRLRASITNEMQQLGAIVSTHTNYAIYVHEGTRFMKGRPFMENAAKFAKQNFDGEIGTRLDTTLRNRLSSL